MQTQRIRDARASLLLTHPFYGVLSLKLNLVEDETFPTIGVNSKEMRFNPKFIEPLSNQELKGLVAHEVSHLALLHQVRQGLRNKGLWNESCDFAINQSLIKEGFTLPKGELVDSRFDGMKAESIYRILESEKQDDPEGNGKGDSSTGHFDAETPDSSECGEAEREWTQNVSEAIRAASSAGKLPEALRREVSENLTGEQPWQELLKRFLADHSKTKNTWSKRNKRFPDIFLPGKIKEGMGCLVVAIDTSGSIDQRLLERFSGELSTLCRDVCPSTVHVVYCDSRVNRVESFHEGEPVTMNAKGGGGTEFQPVFDHVESEGWNPKALVYFTDMDSSDTPAEPGYPVLWAAYNAQRAAAFGETIKVE